MAGRPRGTRRARRRSTIRACTPRSSLTALAGSAAATSTVGGTPTIPPRSFASSCATSKASRASPTTSDALVSTLADPLDRHRYRRVDPTVRRATDRRNIRAHYDLSNEFFELMLDETMAYSCALFEPADATLAGRVAGQARSDLQRSCTSDPPTMSSRSAPGGEASRCTRRRATAVVSPRPRSRTRSSSTRASASSKPTSPTSSRCATTTTANSPEPSTSSSRSR